MSLRIDSHQHFWSYDTARHSWITPDMAAIQRNFLPVDLKPLLNEARIDGSVSVQVDQTVKETLTLLRLGEQNDFIKGIVGWIDLRAADIEDKLSYLKRYEKLKGFRHIVQAEPKGFLLQKDFLRGIGFLKRYNFTYDLLIYPHQLDEAIEFVRLFPEQRFVLDHLAKPPIAKGEIEPWKSKIELLARAENVACKLSGMVTEADWANWKAEHFTPYLDVIFEAFGPQRLLYGSDWPVCTVAANYAQQFTLAENALASFSSSEKEFVMGENAREFYGLRVKG